MCWREKLIAVEENFKSIKIMLRQTNVDINLCESEKKQRTSRCFKASFCVNGERELQRHSKYLKKSSSSENVHKIRRN